MASGTRLVEGVRGVPHSVAATAHMRSRNACARTAMRCTNKCNARTPASAPGEVAEDREDDDASEDGSAAVDERHEPHVAQEIVVLSVKEGRPAAHGAPGLWAHLVRGNAAARSDRRANNHSERCVSHARLRPTRQLSW